MWTCLGMAVYVLAAAALALSIPDEALSPDSAQFFAVIGAIGVWRYGWAAIHLVRAAIFIAGRFPGMRAAAGRAKQRPSHLYVVVTAYRQAPAVTHRVFGALLAEAESCGQGMTIVAAVTDSAERLQLEKSFGNLDPAAEVTLVTMEQDGTGKRSALAEGLRAIARRLPAEDAVVLLMDGDTLLPSGTLAACLPFFAAFPHIAALTTDMRADVTGSPWAVDWYEQRYTQRHLLMSSLSLSGRLLVLTGRFSMFRANLATQPDFIAAVEHDSLRHWRYGSFRFLTGDDKSTWYWLLGHGHAMLYLPDVRVVSLEDMPRGRFLRDSTQRMRRWYGNMLRNNGRALALGPRRARPFVWWCLLDQRISMWTSLVGPASVATAALLAKAALLPAYLLWVMVSRLVFAVGLGMVRGRFTMRWPLLLYYNQLAGAVLKVVVGFNLDRQEWGRQRVWSPARPRQAGWGIYITVLASTLFVYASATASAGLELPNRLLLAGLLGDREPSLQELVDRGGRIRLPEGRYVLDRPLRIATDGVILEGAGARKTVLVGRFMGRDEAIVDVIGPSASAVEKRLCARLVEPVSASATVLAIAGGELPGRGYVRLGMGNDRRFLDELGARRWNRDLPWLRQTLTAFEKTEDARLKLPRPLGVAMPAGASVCPVALREGISIEGLSVVYAIGGDPDAGDYTNARPDHVVDGIRIIGAASPRLRDVEVVGAGRHPLHLDNVLEPSVSGFAAEGAWNKGAGGNGYVRLARTYRGSFSAIRLRGLRHLSIQWSSHGNRIDGLDSDTDVNFHGGFAQDNTVAASRLRIRPNHPWPAVSRTPADALWAPPDGPSNLVVGADGPQ